MDSDGKPASFKSRIGVSNGQGLWLELVIIAITLLSVEVLNILSFDKTNAGRFFEEFLSVKGKGTEATSNCLKIKIRFVVFL